MNAVFHGFKRATGSFGGGWHLYQEEVVRVYVTAI